MKLNHWALLKIALIAFLTVGVVTCPVESADESWGMTLGITALFSFLALFQLGSWFFYDVITLKRGVWNLPTFSDNPFTCKSGLNFHLNIVAIALLTFGAAKIIAAIFQGLPSLILGAGLLTVGGLLLVWQIILRKLFRSRFARRGN